MSETVFLIAPPRSGTTALRSALSKGADCADVGEIFDGSDSAGKFERFFHWRAKKFENDPPLSIPTIENTSSIWEEYLSYIDDVSKSKSTIIDIKYSSLRSIDTLWGFPFAAPYLIQSLKNRQSKVILLWRSDLCRLVVSLLTAGKIGKYYHRQGSEEIKVIKIREGEFASEYREILRAKISVFDWFSGHPNLLKLTYEELFDSNGLLTYEMTEKISDFIGQPVKAVPNDFVKTPVNYRTAVENYAELESLGAELSEKLLGQQR